MYQHHISPTRMVETIEYYIQLCAIRRNRK